MSNNRILIDQSNNTVTTDTTSTQNNVILSPDNPDVVKVVENTSNIIAVGVPGPRGFIGIQGPSGSIDPYYNTGSFSGSFTGVLIGTASYSPNLYNSDGTLTSNRTLSISSSKLIVTSTRPTTNYTFTLGTPTGVTAPSWPANQIKQGEFNISSPSTAEIETTTYWGRNQTTAPKDLWVNQIIANVTAESTGRTSLYNQVYTTTRGSVLDTSLSTAATLIGTWNIIGHTYTSAQATTASIVTSELRALYNDIRNYAGTITNAYGIKTNAVISNTTSAKNSAITNFYGYYLQTSTGTTSGPTGSITNFYGLYLDTPIVGTTGTITNRWGIYAPDTVMNHFIGGKVGINTTSPAYTLDVNGTARVSSGFRNANADFGIQTTIGTTASNSWQSQIIFNSALQSNFFVRGSGNTFSGATSLSGGGILNAICASGTTGDIFAVSNGDIIGDNTALRFVVRGNGEIQVANGAVINPSSRNFTIGGDITIRGGSPRDDVPNSSGGNAIIAGGLGTGTGTPGDVIIGTATATSSGNTIQTLTNRVWIKGGTGNVLINSTSDTGLYKLDVNGSARVSGTLTLNDAGGVAALIANGNAIRVNQNNGTLYIDAGTNLAGTINVRGTTFNFPGVSATANTFICSAASEAIFENSALTTRSTSVASLRINNTTSATTWTFENTRNAPTGSLEISNSTTIPFLTLFPSRAISLGTYNETPSAIFAIDSTTKGFLPPRMTNAQRTAISTPAVGLMVYCTDATEGLYVYKSTGWTFIA